jgi:hypothetical protein
LTKILKLEMDRCTAKVGSQPPSFLCTAAMADSEEEEYEVETLLAKRVPEPGGVPEYKVKWVGYDETSWEPAENINGTLVSQFLKKEQKQAKAKMEPKAKAKAKAEPKAKAAAKRKAPSGKKKPTAATSSAVDSKVGNHKYKDADGRLDRKKNGYYELKNTWESSGEARKHHSGVATSLGAVAMPKAFKKADSSAQREPEKLSGKRTAPKSGATEYKVKWKGLNSAHSVWMDEQSCEAKFGAATWAELLRAWDQWAMVEEEWVGDPLPREVAAARWPKRERPGVLNYEAVIVNGQKICVGDIVRGLADEDYYDDKGGAEDDLENTWVCVVEELWGFESEEFGDMEEKNFAARWFWRGKDTVCKDMATRQPGVAFAMDPRRIFLEKMRLGPDPNDPDYEYMNTGLDDSPVSCIVDVVNVQRRTPSERGLPVDDAVDFFYDMSYDEEFCTFEDVNEFTPPPTPHAPLGAYADGSWQPDAKRDPALDGHLNLLKVFCLQKSSPGNFNLPQWAGIDESSVQAAASAAVAAAAAAVQTGSGSRAKAKKPPNKKELVTARIAQVLHEFVAGALAHSPHKAMVREVVGKLDWDATKRCFPKPPTAGMLRELGRKLDEPGIHTGSLCPASCMRSASTSQWLT